MKIFEALKTGLYYVLLILSKLIPARYAVVLTYHSVSNTESFFATPPEVFAKHVEYLRSNHAIVSLEQVFDFVRGKQDLPRGAVAITCDDGYYDNYANVYPLAKKYGIPLTIFVASEYVGKNMPLGNASLQMLSWEQLREMAENDVTIGSHTLTHPDLRQIDIANARYEIEESKTEIERKVGRTVGFFAYPKGSYSRSLFELLESAAFKAAFRTADHTARKGDYEYELGRMSIDASVNFTRFRAKSTIAGEWFRQIEETAGRLLRALSILKDQ